MFDQLEALIALAEQGTMRRAALSLHISQSAVSKRIQGLEYALKNKLIEPQGRKVILTPFALRYLARARPLISELKEIAREKAADENGLISIDVSVSVLISWGAAALAEAKKKLPGLTLVVNAHHASVAVERVRSGDSLLALVQGESTNARDLVAKPLFKQELAIVPSGLKRFTFPHSGDLPLIMIEAHTEAWQYIKRGISQGQKEWGIKMIAERTLQSFSAITQMARAGFGHGLVPRDVALTLGISPKKLVEIPEPRLCIPVSLIGRRSTLSRPLVQKLFDVLAKQARG